MIERSVCIKKMYSCCGTGLQSHKPCKVSNYYSKSLIIRTLINVILAIQGLIKKIPFPINLITRIFTNKCLQYRDPDNQGLGFLLSSTFLGLVIPVIEDLLYMKLN